MKFILSHSFRNSEVSCLTSSSYCCVLDLLVKSLSKSTSSLLVWGATNSPPISLVMGGGLAACGEILIFYSFYI